jgi:hypothetical protein
MHRLNMEVTELEGLSIDQQQHDQNPYGNPYLDEPPPPPQISSQGIVAFDITSRFLKAAKSMETALDLRYQ